MTGGEVDDSWDDNFWVTYGDEGSIAKVGLKDIVCLGKVVVVVVVVVVVLSLSIFKLGNRVL